MTEDLKVSQIGSFPLPPPFRGLHSPGVRKHSMPEDLKVSQIGSSSLPSPFRGLHSPGVRKQSNYLRLLFPKIVYSKRSTKVTPSRGRRASLLVPPTFAANTHFLSNACFMEDKTRQEFSLTLLWVQIVSAKMTCCAHLL